ncbi:MAG: hypothetical protein U0264_00125 [Candidatus Kapaibacterium sp.]
MNVLRNLTAMLAFVLVSVFPLSAALASDSTDEASMVQKIEPSDTKKHYVRLKNGDILTGFVLEIITDEKEGAGIKIKTAIGIATIYASQIADIRLLEEANRHTHRVYIMPTAEPIGTNHFISNFEGVFLYAGAGWKFLSVTAGRTFVPTVPGSEQFSLLTAKATVYQGDNDYMAGGVSIALGGSLGFLNAKNALQHIFGAATFTMTKTKLTGLVFYKAGAQDFFTATAGTLGSVNVKYPNGAFGIGIGIDTKLSEWNDLRFIAEGWNNDIAVPMNAAALLGIRIGNTSVSADFGIAVFPAPAIVPCVSFAWTPF